MMSGVSYLGSEVHRSRTAVRPHPSNPAYLKDALQEGIVGSKAMMGGGAPTKQQGHGVPLIPKGGLDTNEHVAKLLAIDQQVLALGVELACTTSKQATIKATLLKQPLDALLLENSIAVHQSMPGKLLQCCLD